MYAKSVLILEAELYHYFLNPSSTVLTQNSDHHIDWITSMAIKWKEWKARGLIDLYYFGFIRTLVLRYATPPYSLYLLAREFTTQHILGYMGNPYILERMDEFYQLLLSSLSTQLRKEEFVLLAETAKIYYSIHK